MNNFFTYAKFTKVNKLVKHQKLQKNIPYVSINSPETSGFSFCSKIYTKIKIESYGQKTRYLNFSLMVVKTHISSY